MTRKELADQVFALLTRDASLLKKHADLWQAIAETDDKSLLDEYEKLISKHYTKEEI